MVGRASPRPSVFTARWLQVRPGEWLREGGLLVAGGVVERVLARPSQVRAAVSAGARRIDLRPHVLTPGLVNAHAHLELTDLTGLPREDFVEWVRELVSRRAGLEPAALARAARRGAQRLLGTGTTTVGDIDTCGGGERALAAGPLRSRVYREVLDAGDPARTRDSVRSIRRALPTRALRLEGISPHGPHTASPELLAHVARIAGRRGVPVSIHWAESRAEVDWLREGSGPLAAWLGTSPRVSGLARLDAAGLLGRSTSLVHGNHPSRGDLELLASRGVSLVRCPGTQAFFGRPPFPWKETRAAGVSLALGTDSMASNEDLDLRREMSLARREPGGPSAEEVWRMATLGGARALALAGRVGELSRGAWADLALFQVDSPSPPDILEELTTVPGGTVETWVAGRSTSGASRASGSPLG